MAASHVSILRFSHRRCYWTPNNYFIIYATEDAGICWGAWFHSHGSRLWAHVHVQAKPCCLSPWTQELMEVWVCQGMEEAICLRPAGWRKSQHFPGNDGTKLFIFCTSEIKNVSLKTWQQWSQKHGRTFRGNGRSGKQGKRKWAAVRQWRPRGGCRVWIPLSPGRLTCRYVSQG